MLNKELIEKKFNSPWGEAWGGTIYFIGIGGIGMSAIARFFKSKGVDVSGYDKTETPLTRELQDEGIAVHYEENIELVPERPDLVIYTPAIPKQHAELVHLQANGANIVKRSDVLKLITENSFNICIAGTHGKTTITTMTAHLLRDTGFGCNAFLGGIAVNYGTNFWSSEKNVCVIEADEYDRSFLKLDPNVAIVTAMDADHLDIYGNAASVEEAFIDFTKRIRKNGLLIKNKRLERGNDLAGDNQFVYSLDDTSADVHASNIKSDNGSYVFDVNIKGKRLENVRLNMGGLHNLENALAAITVADTLGIDEKKIRSAVDNFKGIRRRFEYVVRKERFVYIDDYAHHPEELRALLDGAKKLFPGKRTVLAFQPHLFTRTRDFADGFAEVLDMADEVILLPIYPARELPIDGVSSQMLVERMRNRNVRIIERSKVVNHLETTLANHKDEVMLITAGAGDIDTLVAPIKKLFS